MKRAWLVSIATLVGVAHAFAADDKKQAAANGAQIAQAICSECHAVDANADKKSPNPKAPRFSDVAAMPSTTELSIKVFLRSSHKDMPNLMLDDGEIDALSAYILGLRPR